MSKKHTEQRPRAAAVDAAASAITDLSQLPVILRIEDVSRVYRRSVSTIKRELIEGTFKGAMPFDNGRPKRWLRDDIEADLKKRRNMGSKPKRKGSRSLSATL